MLADAIPTTRAPARFASCPATLPVAPAAADTTTVSPGLTAPSSSPKYAVSPFSPSTPRWCDNGPSTSIGTTSDSGSAAHSCQPAWPDTIVPSGSSDSVNAAITSPTPSPPRYVRAVIDIRLTGSIDAYSVRHSTSPGPGTGIGASSRRK